MSAFSSTDSELFSARLHFKLRFPRSGIPRCRVTRVRSLPQPITRNTQVITSY